MAKQNERKKDKPSSETRQITPTKVIMFFLLNFVGFIIFWPLLDLIIKSISHQEFHYDVVSHICSPAIWAVLFTIIDVVWYKNSPKKK